MREVGIILIASFGIDRIVTGLFFLLSYSPELRTLLDPDSLADPEARAAARRSYRLIYAVVSSYLGIVVVAGVMGIRLSKIAGLDLDTSAGPVINSLMDIVITGLLLAGGAERLAEALKLYGVKESKPAQAPIEISGRVVIEQGSINVERGGAGH